MPYIKSLTRHLLNLEEGCAGCAGELNYIFTSVANEYLERMGKNYSHYNDVIGALECCKLEMYRRAIAPYEDTKIAENGDVYP